MDPATIATIVSAAANIGSQFLGGGDSQKKIKNYSKSQNKFFENFIQQLMGFQGGGAQKAFGALEDYLDPNSQVYKNLEAPYRTQFNEQTLPQIAERFAGGAGGGALSSSGFAQALGGAASQFESNLAGMKESTKGNAIQQLLDAYMKMSGQALSAEPFSYLNQQGGGGGGGFDLSNFGNILSQFTKENNGGGNSQPQYPLTGEYSNQLRANPAAFGY